MILVLIILAICAIWIYVSLVAKGCTSFGEYTKKVKTLPKELRPKTNLEYIMNKEKFVKLFEQYANGGIKKEDDCSETISSLEEKLKKLKDKNSMITMEEKMKKLEEENALLRQKQSN